MCVMSSWLVKLTLVPAGTATGVGLNWKVCTVTPCCELAGAARATTPRASTAAAILFLHFRIVSIAASPVAVPPLTDLYGGRTQMDCRGKEAAPAKAAP